MLYHVFLCDWIGWLWVKNELFVLKGPELRRINDVCEIGQLSDGSNTQSGIVY